MFSTNDYELLDFGDGRRLERFGEIVLDRPCPAAESFLPANADLWPMADARFDGRDQERGQWACRRDLPEHWNIAYGPLRFELKRTEFGHLGIFVEQAENWDWIADSLPSPSGRGAGGEGGDAGNDVPHTNATVNMATTPASKSPEKKLKILNLFAYTGGSTLAGAAAGAAVVHVDAAQNVVAWARRNAAISGLADAPIRWIAEDALKFVKRELKRGSRYDAVMLDPPSYGHGPHGEVWRLSKHLPQLLSLCVELTAGRPRLMLLTCHTPGYDAASLRAMVVEAFGMGTSEDVVARPLTIRAIDGRKMPGGVVVRWVGR